MLIKTIGQLIWKVGASVSSAARTRSFGRASQHSYDTSVLAQVDLGAEGWGLKPGTQYFVRVNGREEQQVFTTKEQETAWMPESLDEDSEEWRRLTLGEFYDWHNVLPEREQESQRESGPMGNGRDRK